MKKFLIFLLSALFLASFVRLASARSERSISIPKGAKEVGPGIFSLGEALDVDGRPVQGFMIVKRAATQNSSHVSGPKQNQCYSYLASDTKWKVSEDYMIDATNSAGLDGSQITSIILGGVGKWETAAHNSNVMANLVSWSGDGADVSAPDGKNEVTFGEITNPGVIAVTTVWGVFGGPPPARYLAEWDQVYDQTDYGWSTTGESGKMDLDNIATHEIGHAFGMGHPSDSCTDETMYRFASLGETKKRDLNSGDITGIDKLY